MTCCLLGAVGVASADGAGTPDRSKAAIKRAKVHRLKVYSSCDPFLAYVKARTLPQVGPYGIGGGSLVVRGSAGAAPVVAPEAGGDRSAPPVEGVDFSGTNVQEAGVDEPDVVKTDGITMFSVVDATVRAVRLDGARPRLMSSLELQPFSPSSLLLSGKRLIAIGNVFEEFPDPGTRTEPVIVPYYRFLPKTRIVEIDVTDPSAMKVTAQLTLDGTSFVDARLNGGTARIAVRSELPGRIDFTVPQAAGGETQATDANRRLVAESGAGQWIPTMRLERGGAVEERPLADCAAIRIPPRYAGMGLLSILTVDLARGLEARDADAVVTDGDVLYASNKNMYIATTRWFDPAVRDSDGPPAGPHTAIHKFDITNRARTRYRASGAVRGFLQSQWSMSEHRGRLRVASTEMPTWWNGWGTNRDSESAVTVLEEREGGLIPVGRVGGLGRGEQVYAVRFIGDTGYVVTFRQIDPLYTIDLSDPTRPVVAGELKIPGYSAYLHPLGPDELIGIGQDADENGRPLGTQVSVFDVSDPRNPRRTSRHSLGPAWSLAEWNHRAFLYWPPTDLLMLPLSSALGDPSKPSGFFTGAVALSVPPRGGIRELARVAHPAGRDQGYIQRSVVSRGYVYTVSNLGVLASDLTTLTRRGFAGFPQPGP